MPGSSCALTAWTLAQGSPLPPQGPLPGTVVDFWQMVWQEKTSVIVMLTGLVEHNKVEKTSQPVLSSGLTRVRASLPALLCLALLCFAPSADVNEGREQLHTSAGLHRFPHEFATA